VAPLDAPTRGAEPKPLREKPLRAGVTSERTDDGRWVVAVAAETPEGDVQFGLSLERVGESRRMGLFVSTSEVGPLSVGATLAADGTVRLASGSREGADGHECPVLRGAGPAPHDHLQTLARPSSAEHGFGDVFRDHLSDASARATQLDPAVTAERLREAQQARALLERQIQAELEAHKASVESAARTRSAVAGARRELAQAQQGMAELRRELAAERRRRDTVERAVDAAKASAGEASADAAKKDETIGTLISDVADRTAERDAAQALTARHEQELADARARAKLAGVHATDREHLAESLSRDVDALQSRLEQAQAHADSEAARLSKTIRASDGIAEELALLSVLETTSREKLRETEARLAEAEARLAAAEAQRDAMDSDRARLSGQLSAAKEELTALEIRCETEVDRTTKAQAEAAEARGLASVQGVRAHDLETALAEQTARAEVLEASLAESKARMASLRGQLDVEHRRCAQLIADMADITFVIRSSPTSPVGDK